MINFKQNLNRMKEAGSYAEYKAGNCLCCYCFSAGVVYSVYDKCFLQVVILREVIVQKNQRFINVNF